MQSLFDSILCNKYYSYPISQMKKLKCSGVKYDA